MLPSIMWRRGDPPKTLVAIGREVGVEPRPPTEGRPFGVWTMETLIEGRPVRWESVGGEHSIEWETVDCAIGLTLVDVRQVTQLRGEPPPVGPLRSGLSILIASTPWTTSLEEGTRAWLASNDNRGLLEALPLERRESVGFGWPSCRAVLRDTGRHDLIRVTALVRASDAMVDPDAKWLADLRRKLKEPVRWNRLPRAFRGAARFSRRWAERDDSTRATRMTHATTDELIDLFATIAPMFEAIDVYEGRTADPPEAFLRLTAIAEAAAEARIELERRRVPLPLIEPPVPEAG